MERGWLWIRWSGGLWEDAGAKSVEEALVDLLLNGNFLLLPAVSFVGSLFTVVLAVVGIGVVLDVGFLVNPPAVKS